MAEMIFAMPVLPGKKEAAREMFKEISNSRKNEAEAANQRDGITRETWFLQSSPMGDLLLGYLESDDMEKSSAAYAADTDPYSVWQKGKIKDITGIDVSDNSNPPPPPEQLWKSGY